MAWRIVGCEAESWKVFYHLWDGIGFRFAGFVIVVVRLARIFWWLEYTS